MGRKGHREKLRRPRGAAGVLHRNDFGTWTKPAPSLYPHQWSWDSAFIALGLAHLNNGRAALELETLFSGQWATGKLPHIVFNPEASPKSYFPDAEHWGSTALSSDAPSTPQTSGLCQPPIHAIAVLRIWETAQTRDELRVELARAFLGDNYPRLFAWHRYLATARDPDGSGLVTIYHPWESGTDNSPRMEATVVFIPMERKQSDLQCAHGIVSQMASPQNARILSGEYTSGQVLGFMSHLEFAIGMRLHFLIFAALAGVPFVPLPYASKVEGFVDELKIPASRIQDRSVGRLLAQIDGAWDMRGELRSRVKQHLPPLIEHVGDETADLAADLVRGARVAARP